LIEIRGKITRKLKFFCQLGGQIEEIRSKGRIYKIRRIMGTQSVEIRGEIKEIESLMINRGSNFINPKPMTKEKKARKSRAEIKVFPGM
jgi:hypothetical protein